MASALLRVALVVTVVLCFSFGGNAQNFTASIPLANSTVYRQAASNFSNSVIEPSFPCGSSGSGRVGGYQDLDLDDNEDYDDVSIIVGDVYNYFLVATQNQTGCTFPDIPLVNLSSACSQVVSGTNYALEFTAVYYCFDDDVETLTETLAPLRSTVYVPIQSASLETADQAFNGPVVKDVWFFDTPEVIAEATPEEASAPESAPEAEAPATDSGITLLSPESGSLDSGTTSFTFAPSTSPSPAASSTRSSPTPQVVSGFDEAAQNRSITSG